ncbi:MAG TPA: serine hydrolase domain-containing protein [Roseiflexaceae bacterium]|nr:serine hydrolase domain-containing protein [Roseiflexaceae bacterium]
MNITDTIDSIVQSAIDRRIFPGAVVLVARGAEVCHFAGYGSTMRDAPGSRPVVRDMIYDVASLTKVFTATAALRLADQGRLDLHAPAALYLPELRATGVKVLHLLTHTSGLDIRLSALREAGRDGVMAAVYAAAPVYQPGTVVAYTNVNSLLLGEIVARLYGEPLDIALHALVSGPLGLRDTQFRPPAALLPRIAPTEIDSSWRGGLIHGSVHDESTHALGGVAGHAGLFSTAEDLYRFCLMWLDDQPTTNDQRPRAPYNDNDPIILSFRHLVTSSSSAHDRILRPETIALATANHTRELNLGCGLGWMLDRSNFMGHAPAGSFGHTGFTGPALVVVPQEQLIVVVLSNRVYPQRRPPPFEHHAITTAIVDAALSKA